MFIETVCSLMSYYYYFLWMVHTIQSFILWSSVCVCLCVSVGWVGACMYVFFLLLSCWGNIFYVCFSLFLSLLPILSHSFSHLISVYPLLEIFVCVVLYLCVCELNVLLHSIDKNMFLLADAIWTQVLGANNAAPGWNSQCGFVHPGLVVPLTTQYCCLNLTDKNVCNVISFKFIEQLNT